MTQASGRDVRDIRGSAIAATLYVLFVLLMLLQQPGATTYDTRAELTERPGSFLAGAFSLWHPESNFGEFQNQAYGYLFPQGPWFWLNDLIGTPDWVSQRLWSALILIVACEGARRVARAIGLADLPALLAGVVFALSPRLLGTVSVQTGESLPGAVMPWLVLPVVLHLRGRLSGRATAVLSGAAVVCMGGVNAVETAACLPLAAILVLWGLRSRLVSRRFALGWFGAVGAACVWWALPLVVLARYAPPFFAYVESARDATSLIGWSEATRGDSSWLAYLLSGDRPWWPAAFDLATSPLLVVVAALVAATGLVGLALMDSPVRRPLALAALVGLGCLTVAHGGVAGAPVAGVFQDLLDGSLQIFRNVHKIDPVVRLPLAIGFGTAAGLAVDRLVAFRPRLAPARGALLLAPLLLVAVLGQPFLGTATRTPGWTEISAPWREARDYLVAQRRDTSPGQGDRVLVVPGSSFAQQAWGWTLDEPLAILGGVDVVSRTQVPLVPGESIRYLSALDQEIATGRVTPALGDQLARAGISHVVLRRDLLRALTRSPHPGGAAVSLARAGFERVAGFGTTTDGEAEVEIFRVPQRLPLVRAVAADATATVRGAPESVLLAQSDGVVAPDQPTVLEGESGWRQPADLVTDSDQRRERAFGNNDEGLSALMTAQEPWQVRRAAHDFPAGPGTQVVARYDGLADLVASSAQGYADNFGPVTPASGPYAAVDGDLDTRWITSAATDPERQWIRLDLSSPRAVHQVTVTPVADDPRTVPIRTIAVDAGGQHVRARVSASGVPVVVRLDGRTVRSIRVRVVKAATAARTARVGLRELAVDGLTPRRTFALPGTVPRDARLGFSTTPGRRACFITLTAPDCDVTRIRQPEEAGGLDRSFTMSAAIPMRITGHVVARNTPEAAMLLDQVERRPPVTATSSYGRDLKVAPRFAYDGQSTTAWVSDDADLYPTLTFRWRHPHRITAIAVPAGGVANAPVAAVVTAGRHIQRVSLTGDSSVPIDPVRTRTLQVRFVKAPGAGHVVVPEIRLTGAALTRPFYPNTRTGAVCGYGPKIEVGGRSYDTSVEGTMADLVNGTPLTLTACTTVDVGAGAQRLRLDPTVEFEALDLALTPTSSAGPVAPAGAERAVTVDQWGSTRRTVTVASGDRAVLSLPENFNVGWDAELDGRRLTPIRVDGWQQGWVVPSGAGGRVTLRYAPERTYDVVLPLGLAVSGGVLLAGAGCLVLLLVRRRRGAPRDLTARLWPGEPPPFRGISAAGATVVAVILLGPVAAAGLVAGAFLRTPRAVPGAALLVAASGALDAWGGSAFVTGTADVAAAVGVGLVAGVVLGRPGRREPAEVVA